MELHHIVPEAEGGENTGENAIILCFDCHAAAGHYNPKHPRGTKFSPAELRSHRDSWLNYVRTSPHGLDEEATGGHLSGRYLLTSDRLCARKLIEIDKTSVVSSTFLLRDRMLSEFSRLDAKYPDDRPDHETDSWSDLNFSDRATLYKRFPELRGKDMVPLSRSIVDKGLVTDPFALELLDLGVLPEDLGVLQAFHEECGDSGWRIDVKTRRPSYVFFEVRNISNVYVNIESVYMADARSISTLLDDRPARYGINMDSIATQNLLLGPSETLMVFLGVLAGPIGFEPTTFSYFEGELFDPEDKRGDLSGDTLERLSYTVSGVSDDFVRIGRFATPHQVAYSAAGKREHLPMHAFDGRVLFFISREWLIGSCPHLYGIRSDGTLEHVTTLFEPDRLGSPETYDVSSFEQIVVAEIENEVSFVTDLRLDGVSVCSDRRLLYGESIFLNCSHSSSLTLTGEYQSVFRHAANAAQRAQKTGKRIAFEREFARHR